MNNMIIRGRLLSALLITWAAASSVQALAQTTVTGQINILSVSPRERDRSTTDSYDETASGLNVVPVGAKVYFQANPQLPIQPPVTNYWSVSARPQGSTAQLSDQTGDQTTFRPDAVGTYVILLRIQDGNGNVSSDITQVLHAAKYVGAGVFGDSLPVPPNCGTSYCHGSDAANPDLRIVPEWIQSNHANKLQNHLNGNRGAYYATACLECHTVGDNPSVSGNGGFEDVAAQIGYDLNQIPALVQDAVQNHHQNFSQLPSQLRNLASIQCESCHGPGSLHPQSLGTPDKAIAGHDLSTKQCAQCHDSASGFQQKFYQWSSSTHPITASLAEGAVAQNTACLKCHTGEGFVDVRADGLQPTIIPNPNSITCSTCHDPHFSPNAHQLRVVGDFTLDSGQTFTNPGLGGLCMRCHNSRVANPETTSLTSSRGAHHGPQTDMILSVNGATFGLPVEGISFHSIAVEDTCVHCHMAPGVQSGAGITEPPKVGEHSFSMRDGDVINAVNVCQQCHDGLNTYDRPAFGDYDGNGKVEGVQTEIKGLFNLLQTGILANMHGTSVDPATGRISISSTDFNKLTNNQKYAIYNYNFVWEDGSFGVHNTSYAVQLLQRSYYGVYGRPIQQDYANITLRGPTQSNNRVDQWETYD